MNVWNRLVFKLVLSWFKVFLVSFLSFFSLAVVCIFFGFVFLWNVVSIFFFILGFSLDKL